MGPKNACSYADLAMAELDRKAKFCGPIKPALWWRYQDDIFDLWQQGLPALEEFTHYINSLYPTIKFELVFSESRLNSKQEIFIPPIPLMQVAISATKVDAIFVKIILSNREIFVVLEQVNLTSLDPI